MSHSANFSKPDAFLVGLDGSGKTTLLFKLKEQNIDQIPQTVGFNLDIVEHQNYSFKIFDLGGHKNVRSSWNHHYFLQETRVLIYMVDATDGERIKESRTELIVMLKKEELKNAIILICANKKDQLPNEYHKDAKFDFIDEQLKEILCNRRWNMLHTSVLQNLGISEGLDWICKELNKGNKI